METILGSLKGEKGRRPLRAWEGKINFPICSWGQSHNEQTNKLVSNKSVTISLRNNDKTKDYN